MPRRPTNSRLTEPHSIRFDPVTWQRLKQKSEDQMLGISLIVDRAVESYLEDYDDVHDWMDAEALRDRHG